MPSHRIYIEVVERKSGNVIKRIDITGKSRLEVEKIEELVESNINTNTHFINMSD